MKRLISILVVFAMLVCSCGNYRDFKVTSFDLVSVTPHGFGELDALVDVGIYNPMVTLVVKEVEGTLKYKGEPCLYLYADQLVLDGKTNKIYSIPVKGSIPDGFSILKLIPLAGKPGDGRLTADLNIHAALRNGIGKTIVLKDIEVGR